MWAIGYVVLFVALTGLPLVYHHTELYGFSALQATLAIFSSVNAMICFWEMALFFHRAHIKARYLEYKKLLPKCTFPSPMFMFQHVSLLDALTFKFWSQVWSNYSLMDSSYQDQTTFGFFVDVGNGFTTILPTILFAVGMTWPLMEARTLGVISIIKFYQELYGTVIYFFSYILNGRYRGASASMVIGIVVSTNGLWFIFPAIGMWACYQLIVDNSYAVFQT